MLKPIKSQALAVNLAETRELEFTIPQNHLWFLTLTENYWGIHKRTTEFITEFHHPYSNRKEVIEQLNNVAISDFWVYHHSDDGEKIIQIFLDFFDVLLQEVLPDELSKQLVFIYLSFFQKNYGMIAKYESCLVEFLRILDDNFDEKYFSYIINIKFFIKTLSPLAANSTVEKTAFLFLQKLIKQNITFWENSTNIEKWYQANKSKMTKNYTDQLKPLGKEFFQMHSQFLNDALSWDDLCKAAFTFTDIIDAFRKKIDIFEKATEQFSYIFYLIHLPGMIYHRNYLLIDLNNAIKKISHELNAEQTIQSIDELFLLFIELKNSHINMILDSILTLGKEIINTGNTEIIHYFENKIIHFGFITPGVVYMTNDWTLEVDRNHIKNIRVWLELIEYGPEMMKRLLSALIINLRLGGIFIFDTDLFQKDVTTLLNAEISPIYKQIKQLTRIFPIYFNEIGAEGLLRDVTTQIDELSQRNDKLIHFLRKQIHTEGNNSHIKITLGIINFWYNLDKNSIASLIPPNVIDTIDIDGSWVTGVHKVLHELCTKNNYELEALILKDKQSVKQMLAELENQNESDLKRVGLIIELYQILKEKYSFEANNIAVLLRQYPVLDRKDIDKLEVLLTNSQDVESLKLIFSFMVKLNHIIFDPAISEGWENIYYKRHVAFGIPSMYGEYHEAKFEALGITFRLERIASVLMSKIIAELKTDYFTAKTLKDVSALIDLLRDGLNLDGISDQGFDSKLKMFQYSLTSGSFTIRQYINIFQFMEVSIKEIINKYFIRPYDELLKVIIPQLQVTLEQPKSDNEDKDIVKKAEIFYRELLSSAFLIQALDNFIGDVLNNLRKMVSYLSDDEIRSIMTYDPDLVISPLYTETPTLDNQVFLGSKAYYLKKLYLKQYPVPPGFVITTEVFRRINSIIKLEALNTEIDVLIQSYIAKLENITGLKFGDPEKPLLLSVRSGAAISMPGAMNTFLNVGLNDEITEMLSKQNNFAWTSWDCYRRLLQTWGMSYGLDRNDFDQIMIDYKQRLNITQKIDFTPAMMKEIAYSYKQLLIDNDIHFESDPFLQIKQAIISVFYSWNSARTKVYRQHMHIADEWGTAVIVQQMVFGNLHRQSGSGVLFTHDIQDNISGINLTGDFSFLSQGEDIVAGLINTLPLSERQRVKYYHNSPVSLESAFPQIYGKLNEIAQQLLETDGFGHQEIEFTFETDNAEDLYILQTRDMSIRTQKKMMVFATPEEEMKRVGCGIGIGNEVLNGVIVFDDEDIEILKKKNTNQKAVLVRPDTVPDDIEMIFECDGLLTGKGGATSHAAVTASTLGKVCVVNCADMIVYEKEKKCVISNNVFNVFDLIAIDGNNGIVYQGNYPIKIQ